MNPTRRRMRLPQARNRRQRRRRLSRCRAGWNSCNCWSGSRWSFLTSQLTSSPSAAFDKFKLAVNSSVSLATIGASAVSAAYGQAIDSPEGYGQGAEGYGKRFGSGMARGASENLFGTFLIASVLREDPRFYVRKNLSFNQSVKYSAVRIAITRSDSGKRVVNFAGLLGPLAGETLANTYFPEGNRGISDIFIRYAVRPGLEIRREPLASVLAEHQQEAAAGAHGAPAGASAE